MPKVGLHDGGRIKEDGVSTFSFPILFSYNINLKLIENNIKENVDDTPYLLLIIISSSFF